MKFCDRVDTIEYLFFVSHFSPIENSFHVCFPAGTAALLKFFCPAQELRAKRKAYGLNLESSFGSTGQSFPAVWVFIE